MKNNNRFYSGCGFFVIGGLMMVPFVIVMAIRLYLGISFDINCKGYLKRAADANTVETAAKELDLSIKYLEDHHLTTGYTSVLWKEPSEDIGFFYNNLKSSREELSKVTSQTSQLEKSNLLIKLRETLLDHAEKGTSVTYPDSIYLYPNNVLFFVLGWISFLLAFGGACCWALLLKDY